MIAKAAAFVERGEVVVANRTQTTFEGWNVVKYANGIYKRLRINFSWRRRFQRSIELHFKTKCIKIPKKAHFISSTFER